MTTVSNQKDAAYDGDGAEWYENAILAFPHQRLSEFSAAKRMGDVRGKRVLDIGCGDGRWPRRMLNEFGAAHVTGVDLSEAMVECARVRCTAQGVSPDAAVYVVGDICSVELAASPFDAAMTLYGLSCYSSSMEDLITRFRVVLSHLNDGGKFLVAHTVGYVLAENEEWMKANVPVSSYKVRDEKWRPGLPCQVVFNTVPPGVLNFFSWSAEDVKEALTKAGFENVESSRLLVPPHDDATTAAATVDLEELSKKCPYVEVWGYKPVSQ